MALVKVSLMSELAMLRLLQVGRRRADQHYQQATQEYCAQLRDLYLAGVRERRRRLRHRQAANVRRNCKEADDGAISETFKLVLTEEGVPGISLARSSLPHAKQGDQVQLLRTLEEDDTGELELLTRGVILLVNEQQVRIKFHEPLNQKSAKTKAKTKTEAEAKAQEIDDQIQVNGNGDSSLGKVNTQEGAPYSSSEHDGVERVICFRVKLDSNLARAGSNNNNSVKDSCEGDEYEQLIDEVLHNFVKFKCNQALHRNLMGLYDERTEVGVSDRTRVLPARALGIRLRPNGQQRAAIEQALKRRLTLIEGPAGTGKTLVGALIAANACRLRGKSRVLVCSPLQSTVDKLTGLLLQLLDGHQQVIKLPENATASTRNPRLARRAPSSGSGKQRRPVPPNHHRRGERASFVSQMIADDDEDQDQEQEEDEHQQLNEANRAHLDKIVDDEIYLQAYARSKDTLGNNHEQLHAHAYRMVTSCSPLKRRDMEAKMISRANVVCCTLVQAGSYLLKGAEFDMLILDDVQLTSELDCLVAIMTRGIKQVTLLSDTRRRIRLARSRLSTDTVQPGAQANSTAAKQVPGPARTGSRNSNFVARINSESLMTQTKPNGRGAPRTPESSNSESSDDEQPSSISRNGARSSPTTSNNVKSRAIIPPPGVSLEPGNLFERLLALGLPTVDLRVQYRCHATLSNFFNHHFYAGRLKDDRKTNEKLSAEINTSLLVREQNFAWMPNRKYLTGLFWAANSNLESTTNHVLDKLLKDENIQESRIGVIYNKHWLLGRAKRDASSHRSSDLKQATIDGFIGQERDFIIMVAGDDGGISFSEDEISHLGLTSEIHCDFRSNDAALNWALTRAKLGLFVVAEENKGDGDCGSWRELVKYYDANKLTNST